MKTHAARPAPPCRVSAIVPARNEEACIGAVVTGLLACVAADGGPLIDEVVVADNGSTDATAAVALAAGARVLTVPRPGYGEACWHAVQASRGEVLIFVDGDGAADPADARWLLGAIDAGAELAVGLRLTPDPGALTAAQRWGNALACWLMRLIWQVPAADLGPYRALRRTAFDRLDMRDRAYGWTVEMQVRAHRLGLCTVQLPVAWRARAGGVSKISGSLRGVVGAGCGILGMIGRLWLRELARRPGSLAHRLALRLAQARALAPNARR
ncbi:glycosyltransferase family 2 protein [Derxia lacustris]|uniref:glycosyltransferase family 2 protein n=1 Tax=Derxia lacustris TaxID=764842 RepID=UPI000A1732CC|nr:glycosyltransferase family 2 protein [Derxia lacustris]